MVRWIDLDKLFIKTICELFEWPADTDPYQCVSYNLQEHIGWKWDGESIKLYMYGYSNNYKGELYFCGPIYKESSKRISEIEALLTKAYISWSYSYMNILKQKVLKAVQSLYSRGIPVEKLTMPPEWLSFLGSYRMYLGFPVEKGEQIRAFSSKYYGAYAPN